METKILIRLFALDDDAFTRKEIKDALDHADIENYEIFSDHVEFLEKFNEHVHIAIIDHHLDGPLTGFEVMEQLLDINPACHVIIISGNKNPDMILKYWDAGSYKFIHKYDPAFIGKLVVGVNKAYRKINSILSFYQAQLERRNEKTNADAHRKLDRVD